MKATAFTVGVGGEGETQNDASEEESRTAVDDGAGSDSDSEGEGELSEGESECEGVRVSRDCVRPSRDKSSVYNHLVSSTDCCRTYSDSCFSVLCRARHGYLLQLQVLEAVCQRIHKPNLCVQKDTVMLLPSNCSNNVLLCSVPKCVLSPSCLLLLLLSFVLTFLFLLLIHTCHA